MRRQRGPSLIGLAPEFIRPVRSESGLELAQPGGSGLASHPRGEVLIAATRGYTVIRSMGLTAGESRVFILTDSGHPERGSECRGPPQAL